jgi:hypothetical protein
MREMSTNGQLPLLDAYVSRTQHKDRQLECVSVFV